MDTLSQSSTEPIYVEVDDRKLRTIELDAVLGMAVTPAGAAAPATFAPAAWSRPGREVTVDVGPGTTIGTLPLGELDVWVSIGSGPRRAIRRAPGGLMVTT